MTAMAIGGYLNGRAGRGTSSYLCSHLAILCERDENFLASLHRRPAGVVSSLRLISEIESRQAGRYGLRESHAADIWPMFAALPERPFIDPPAASDWIASALDRRAALRTSRQTSNLLADFLRLRAAPGTCLYGGVKSRVAMQNVIAAWRQSGAGPDFWDAVRFRIVVPALSYLPGLAIAFDREFHGLVVRCHNYYLSPRPGHLYRAIHFELRLSRLQFAEVQMVTATRDAVGLLDHAFLHKRSISFLDRDHRRWLCRLSEAATAADAAGPIQPLPG